MRKVRGVGHASTNGRASFWTAAASHALFAVPALLTGACIEFEASVPTESLLPEEGASRIGGEGVPPEVAASLPDDLPQTYLQGERLGEDCSDEQPCRGGLACEDGVCEALGEATTGDSCILSEECEQGQCVDNQCVPFGERGEGEECLSLAECGPGLRCGVVNFSAQCVLPGEADLGQACLSSDDCMAGLVCVQANSEDEPTCVPVNTAPPAVPALWEGVECEKADKSDVRAYFEIPGAPGADEGDFFRLPFPNDVLLDDRGRVQLSDFPTPGVNPLVGVDPILNYVEALEGTRGWGTNSTVTFRFSGPISLASFQEGINWVDITDPDNPVGVGIYFKTYTGNTHYVCHNMLSVRRANGFAMQPGHVYAVWLSTEGRSGEDEPISRAPNFTALLEDESPEDPTLSAAHAKYAPFRDYLVAQEIDAESVLVASVITIGPVLDPMAELAETTLALPTPEASGWVRCDGDSESPCAQASPEEGRACGEPNDVYDEYHALVQLPIFQRGTAPYLEEGGEIQTDEPVRSEPVCMALSVPKAVEPPPEGWPLVVFTHGTGGSFRSHLTGPVAERLSAAGTPDGEVAFAVLGYDQVQHGPRRGESTESPDNLFFNFLNPHAARGNPLQGAADVLSVGRFASGLSLGEEVTGSGAMRVDPERIVYFGHSQGAMHGSLALPYASQYKAAVLSGNGVSLMHAMLTKTQPVNIAQVVPLMINDGVQFNFEDGDFGGELPGGDHHPVLSLIQHYIDPADPVNFAKQIAKAPFDGQAPKHIFQTYGLDDHFSPPLTMRIYAATADLDVVRASTSADDPDDLGPEGEAFPFKGSFDVEGVEYTVAVRQYGPPEGQDGHFVAFDVPEAAADVARFLGMAASGQTPQIGE